MAYGLRKINKDGKHYNFQWPMEVGDVATCPDWEPTEKCGNGLHFIVPNEGDMWFLDGHYWAVVEYDPEQAVSIHNGEKHKAETLKIIHITENKSELLPYFSDVQFNSMWAYFWAQSIGDAEVMRPLITESKWAYHWALTFGDVDLMRPLIVESEWACEWARNIGDVDVMRPLITESKWAYYWAIDIGDEDVMRPLVAGTEWAALWEMYYSNHR